jgi:nucleotide-binding universal stress UspA family protein
MYRAILVPLDGSTFGEHALPLALSVARPGGAELHLVHSHVADLLRTDGEKLDAEQQERERAYLSGVAERLAASSGGPITTALLDGPVAEAIAAYAEAEGIELVVLTTHGRGAFSRAWLGSVADRLLRRLPMPMLMVRPHEAAPAEIASPPRISHLLVPLDGSKLSEGILPHALALGRPSGAAYTLLQVVELPLTDYGFGTFPLSAIDIDARIAAAHQYLGRVAAPLQAEGLQVMTNVIVGWPALSILDYARDHAVNLIALATHGYSGAARLFLGSVADKVLRGAAVPVLLWRPVAETSAPPSS